jgi:succinate dehydrogenase/fumarate reductase flavoprotein subunit
MGEYPFQETDVLIIGGGGAGIRAAIEAASRGARAIVANKGPVGRSGTTPMAMEAFQAVAFPGDSEEIHFRDTVEGGYHLGDENLISVLVGDAPRRARELETYGVQFKKKAEGTYDPMHHPGQTFPRALFIQGGGFGMLAGLIREARKHPGIQLLSDVFVYRLTVDREGGVSGALYLDLKDGRVKAIQCKAVVLATGGYEELWARNDASCTACGDGISLAYEAGAELVDLEMLQYYPTVVIHPPSIKGTLFQYELITDPQMLGGRLVNGKEQPFFEGKLLRDAIVRAIWKEVREGRGTPHGGVSIDLVHSTMGREELTRALEKWQPNQFHYLRDMGFDLREVMVEVAPHAHYTLGGVAIDEKAGTTVPGLFAAGEVAGNLHGANRVSGNALAETQVFGALAGASAAGWAKGRRLEEKSKAADEDGTIEALLNRRGRQREGGLRPGQVREKLQEILWNRCGVERDARGLALGIQEMEQIEREMPDRMIIPGFSGEDSFGAYPQEVQEALEVRTMVSLGKLVMASALFRKETRGHHMRADYPSPAREPAHTRVMKGKEPRESGVKRREYGKWKG